VFPAFTVLCVWQWASACDLVFGVPGAPGVSMSEIPNTGENHGQVTLVGCFDH